MRGKSGRNEGRKLFATLLNNIVVGWALAGLVQPALGLVNEERGFSPDRLGGTLAFLALATIFTLLAQAVIRPLEDRDVG